MYDSNNTKSEVLKPEDFYVRTGCFGDGRELWIPGGKAIRDFFDVSPNECIIFVDQCNNLSIIPVYETPTVHVFDFHFYAGQWERTSVIRQIQVVNTDGVNA